MRALRPILVLALTAALCSSGLAASTTPAPTPDEVLVMGSLGGLRTVTYQPGYTLRFERDGIAIYDGMLDGRDGHYTAPADFTAVAAAVTQARLCERNGLALFISPNARRALSPSTPREPKGIASDAITLRCGPDVKTFNTSVAPDLPTVSVQLLDLGKTLAWHYEGPAQRETIVRFAH
jgi:hypothetical protein